MSSAASHSASLAPSAGVAPGQGAVRTWLWVVALMIVAMVIVGGATRLTESGLSITEWKPIHGMIPPLSDAEWQEEFDKYRQIPQYTEINKGMSLEAFKTIFWWEWAHRQLGRLIGLVFLVPFLVFAARGAIERSMLPRLGLLFVLGGLQGAIGWWMVASGLTERTDVSQYRLATHLTFACVLLVATVWIAEGFRKSTALFAEPSVVRRGAKLLVGLLLAQVFLGGLVAGLNAGLIYNTWPLMDGRIVPDGLLAMSPWWLNFFESHLTVQFVHRIGAYVLLAATVWHLVTVRRAALDRRTVRRAWLLTAMVVAQAVIGIVTLLLVVPIGIALVHQAMAAILLVVATVHAHRLSQPAPSPAGVFRLSPIKAA
ncbi:COX15/CtaA family protein [Methylobrevis albus]|uniref:Heme A synthase n=1 Tax=Methylobrevis albus TaxID=2793297 RepID=A0A931MZG0_9HYPH|nr:COX15/CtaA family protein [Methylobrevis albus]MBH0238990.1 COX15/CtaA family protein [Methylobrevis albus]